MHQQILLAYGASGPPATYSGWDGTVIAGVVYSNSNRTATATSVSGLSRVVKSAVTKSTGKFYIELQVQQSGGGFLGIGFRTGATGTFLGNNTAGWGFWDGYPSDERAYHNNSFTAYASGTDWLSGARMGFAIDMTIGRIWVRRGATFIGDPVAGTGATWSFTPGASFAPAADLFDDSVATYYANPADHTFSAPSGFTAGWPD